ncbi:LOW QUALITY PROTEIN: Olfactory receptor 958, partial [Galemys pyrenaicus]
CMNMQNCTSVMEFILLGIPNTEGLEAMLFVLFFTFYLFTLLGNLLIFLTILISSTLHTPMYFFLGNLSVFDIFFPSFPKMMLYLMGRSRTISYQGCASQLFFYHVLGGTECFLYTVMAYDRFAAICHPLRYTVIMNYRVCTGLTLGTWLGGWLHGSILTFLVFKLPYCGPNEVDNFFCDIPVVLPLACADTTLAQTMSFTNVDVVTLTCFFLILTSYGRIVLSILKISSSEGRCRAFSACSAHLISILLFYGPVMLIYLRPASSPWLDSVRQVLDNIVTPSLKPLIYTLRNKDAKTHTPVTEFLLLGIPHTQGLENVLFISGLLPAHFSGKLLILLAILTSSNLHTPMYFFLGNLSVFDISESSPSAYWGKPDHLLPGLCLPALLLPLFGMYCVFPVHPGWGAVCTSVSSPSSSVAHLCPHLPHLWHICVLTFLICGPNEVDNFFCDIPVVLTLAGADIRLAQMVSFTSIGIITLLALSSNPHISYSHCYPYIENQLCRRQVLNNIVTLFRIPLIYTLRNKN